MFISVRIMERKRSRKRARRAIMEEDEDEHELGLVYCYKNDIDNNVLHVK